MSHIECSFHFHGQTIARRGKELQHLYLVKTGSVNCFGLRHNYMYNLQPGSFFGEYCIMFGLYNHIEYKAHIPNDSKSDCMTIFQISNSLLMEQLCKDGSSFEHLHNLSLQKLRYNQQV